MVLLTQFLKKLRIKLQYSELCENLHFVVLLIILLFFLFQGFNFLILICFITLFGYLFLRSKTIWIFSLIVIFLIGGHYLLKNLTYKQAPVKINGVARVIQVIDYEDYQKVKVRYGGYKYLFYDKTQDIKIGDLYYIQGIVKEADFEHQPNGFNYQKYLKYQNIIGTINIQNHQYLGKTKIISINLFNDLISKYYDNHFSPETANFLKAIIIGNKDYLEKEVISTIQTVGISHLFVVSGLHVSIIVLILEKVLRLFKIKETPKTIITIVFLGCYLILTRLSISVFRVIVSYILKKLKLKSLTALDLISINFLIALSINPFMAYTYSFILTYLISFMIIIIEPLINSIKVSNRFGRKIISMTMISIGSIVVTLPVVISLNPEINFLSIIYNLFYIPLMSYVILPFSLIVSFLPFLKGIVNILVKIFYSSTTILSNFRLLNFSFKVFSKNVVIIYYLMLFLIIYLFEHRFKIAFLIYPIFLLGWSNINYLNMNDTITFLDLKEGESVIVEKAFNQGNVIIDTGVSGNNELETYLRKKGIKRIDLLIISHGDDDHNGQLVNLINNFKVRLVIINKYDSISEQKLIDNHFTSYIKLGGGDDFNFKGISFKVLWPINKMDNSNNNSLVFIMNFYSKTFLFTGDIEKEAEQLICEKYKDLKVDVLKIAHHGSNTSTSKEWLDKIEFDVGIAMNGYRNTFGFPNNYVVNRLKEYQVYYTIECYTITLKKKFYQKDFKVSTLKK